MEKSSYISLLMAVMIIVSATAVLAQSPSPSPSPSPTPSPTPTPPPTTTTTATTTTTTEAPTTTTQPPTTTTTTTPPTTTQPPTTTTTATSTTTTTAPAPCPHLCLVPESCGSTPITNTVCETIDPGLVCCQASTTTTTTTTSTTTTTIICTPSQTGIVIPWQVVYPDDELFPPDDVIATEASAEVKPSLPYITGKPIVLGGLRQNNRIARAKITTCENAITGKFEIEIDAPGVSIPKYESENEHTVIAHSTKTFNFNSQFAGTPTDIPFNSPSDEIQWTPQQAFTVGPVTETTTGKITVKFAGTKIGETTFTIKPSKNWNVQWKALPLGGDFKIASDRLIQAGRNRASGDNAFLIKANYPVDNTKFFPVGSLIAAEWPKTKNMRLVDWLNQDEIQQFIEQYRFARDWSLAQKRGDISHIIFMTQDGMLGLSPQINGLASGPKAAFIEEDAPFSTDAHELGHLKPWDLDHDYDEQNPRGIATIGYLATFTERSGGLSARPFDPQVPSHSMMGRPLTLLSDMIRKDHYRTLLEHLPGEGLVDPQVWMLRGILTAPGGNPSSFEASPIYHFDSFTDADETCDGNPQCLTLKVKVTLQDNSVIEKELAVSTAPITPDDSGEIIQLDFFVVTHAFDMPLQSVKKVRVEDENNNLLYEKVVSANAPTLTIDSVEVKNNKIEVKTKSEDADSDTLYASFFIEIDEHADGVLLDEKLTGKANKFTADVTLPPGSYKAIIMVTDGFNTAEAEAPFTVAPALLATSSPLDTLNEGHDVVPITT